MLRLADLRSTPSPEETMDQLIVFTLQDLPSFFSINTGQLGATRQFLYQTLKQH